MRGCWAVSLMVGLASVGCAEEVPITTEPDIAYGELSNRMSIGELAPETLLVVGDPDVLAASVDVLVASLAPVVGRPDPSSLWVQLIVMSPDATADALETLSTCRASGEICASAQPPTVTYRAAPYGYATDIDQWMTNARCLLLAGRDCEVDPNPAPTFSNAFHPITVMWLDDDVVCDASDACATQPIERVRALYDSHRVQGHFRILGEAPLPEALETIVYEEYGPRHGEGFGGLWLKRVAVDENGLPTCVLRETLPTTGPITRCEQLTDYGRAIDSVNANDQDVCRITPRPEPLPDAFALPGFYYDPEYPNGYPTLVFAFDLIGGSLLEWRCTLDVN